MGRLSVLCILVLLCLASLATAQEILVPGRDWVEVVPPVFAQRKNPKALWFDQKLWVIGGNDGQVESDVWYGNATNWTRSCRYAFPPREYSAVATFKGKMWVIGGSKPHYLYVSTGDYHPYLADAWSSDDGDTWTNHQGPVQAPFIRAGHSAIEFQDKFWIIGGENTYSSGITIERFYNDVWSSEDGTQWTKTVTHAPFPGRRGHSCVVFDQSLWVIGGYTGNGNNRVAFNDLWRTEDGVNWTSATLTAAFAPRYDHACAVHDGKLWVLGGRNASESFNDIWTSSDGINWTGVVPSKPLPAGAGQALVANDEGLWLFGNDSASVLRSHNGIDWNAQPDTNPGPHRDSLTLPYKGRLWSFGSGIWSSADGANWSQDALSAPGGATCGLVFQNNLWLFGYDLILKSGDGINWTQITTNTSMSNITSCVVLDQSMWVLGNGAWTTFDGETWNSVSTPYELRVAPAVASLGQALYSLGGYTSQFSHGYYAYTYYNDVWNWTLGTGWSTSTQHAAFQARYGARAIGVGDQLWLIGGSVNFGPYEGTLLNDVWSSSDGTIWDLATEHAAFPPRKNHNLFIFNDKLWVSGGFNEFGRLNDIWYTEMPGSSDSSVNARSWAMFE